MMSSDIGINFGSCRKLIQKCEMRHKLREGENLKETI